MCLLGFCGLGERLDAFQHDLGGDAKKLAMLGGGDVLFGVFDECELSSIAL